MVSLIWDIRRLQVDEMRKCFIRMAAALSLAAGFGMNAYAVLPGISLVRCGNGGGEIPPGEYLVSCRKPVRVTDPSTGTISLIEGVAPKGTAIKTNISEGFELEFSERVYLFKDTEGSARMFNTMGYISYPASLLIQYLPGSVVEVGYGAVCIRNAEGTVLKTFYGIAPRDAEGYIINPAAENNGKKSKDQSFHEPVALESGKIYRVGSDLNASSYCGTGTGIVRVYNSGGYVKTVIRLKNADSSEQGVESYVFNLSADETLCAEGDIKLAEVSGSK